MTTRRTVSLSLTANTAPLGLAAVRLKRKYSWPQVSRSTTSMKLEQAGQRKLGGWGGSMETAMPSNSRKRSRAALRLRLTKRPKCRMRTRPPGLDFGRVLP